MRDGFFNTDLAAERRRADTTTAGIEYKKSPTAYGSIEKIRVTSEAGAKSIGRPLGRYDTLNIRRMDLLDNEEIDDIKDAVARELCEMMYIRDIEPDRILVVGLGNPSLTPDSIGAEVAKKIEPTMHLRKFDEQMFNSLDCSEIAVIAPGVTSNSGIDAKDTVRGMVETIEPDAVIVVDSLAARSPKRLGTTLQFCDTGIHPGSGVGSHREAIDEDSIGVPVFAVGVPTVIDSRLFIGDGEGTVVEGMFVSPKDIDTIVKNAGEIIAGGINQAFGIYM